MNLLSLFETTSDRSKLSKSAAELRCKNIVTNCETIPTEHHAQLGRMPFGTKQRVTTTIKNGQYIYFLRSDFGGGSGV